MDKRKMTVIPLPPFSPHILLCDWFSSNSKWH